MPTLSHARRLRFPRLPAAIAATALLWLCGGGVAAELPPPAGGVLEFAIVRKGDVIGNYRSDFTVKPDGGLEVITRIKAEIFLGPVRLYHFQHSSTETWRDGHLVSLFSDTDDDGDNHHLQAHEDGGALALMADGNTVMTAANSVPSSLWSLSMVAADRPIFDIVDGQLFKTQSHCEADPAHPPEGPGTLCQITGELERTLRYTPEGALDGVSFAADDGSRVLYRRR